jgi:mRNA interferase MazF
MVQWLFWPGGHSLMTVNGIQNKAMSDQIMSADKSRLKNKIGVLSDTDILSLENALKDFLDLTT